MDTQTYALSLVGDAPRPGPVADALRASLGGLERLYGAGLSAYLLSERLGLRRRARLSAPVLSVGGLSVGGAGKTPMTQWLARRLGAAGVRTAILSRGHGGAGPSVRAVSGDTGGVFLDAAEAGDEPRLLALTLPGTPVLVGKDRRDSGREALRRFDLDALILDDGFQFWQLARDLDIVLLDARRPFANGHALPRGLLREPARGLGRAGVVVATRAGGLDADARDGLARRVARFAPSARLFFADHRAVGFVPADDLAAPVLPLDLLAGRPAGAACAIARPEAFRRTLEREARTRVLFLEARADHHPWTAAEARAVVARSARAGAEAVVITEKDAVKWPASDVSGPPVYALRIEMAVDDEDGFLRAVLAALGRRPEERHPERGSASPGSAF